MEKKHSKKKLVVILIIVFAVLIAAGVGAFIFFNSQQNTSADGVTGKVSPGWEYNIGSSQQSSNTGTKIPGYSTATMKEGDKSLHISIGNPKTNTVGFYATLKLEDGTVLYKSELIEPGSGITEVPLEKTLSKGNYNAMVEYRCVSLENPDTSLNSAVSEFTLTVN